MGRLTAQGIIDLALDIVGNTRIEDNALSWLNLILDQAAQSHRFPDLEKQHSATVTDGIGTLAYPTDYGFLVKDRNSRAEGKFVSSDGLSVSRILQTSLGATRDAVDHVATSGGVPIRVADDMLNAQWILHPIVNQSGTVYLNYQRNPATITMSDVPWYPQDAALVDVLAFYAERRQRGGQIQIAAVLKEASSRLARAAPSRAQLWRGGSGSGLDPSCFR